MRHLQQILQDPMLQPLLLCGCLKEPVRPLDALGVVHGAGFAKRRPDLCARHETGRDCVLDCPQEIPVEVSIGVDDFGI